MPTRISIYQRIIQAIGVPVQGLGVIWLRDYNIRRNKPTDEGIIKSCVVVIESIFTIEFLVCKELDRTFRPP